MKKKWLLAGVLALGAFSCAFVGCDETKDETVYGDWYVAVAATCEENGVEMRVALNDETKLERREIPATGHDWNEWEEVTAPDCLVAGMQKRSCNTCENYDYQPVPALGHDWGEWETTAAPSCDTEGYQTRTCLRDGEHTQIRKTQAPGHDWSEWVVTTAPTCETDGVETRYCRNDNIHTQERALPAYGHVWSEWVLAKAPTQTEDGEKVRICENHSSHIETRAVPALCYADLNFALNADGASYSVSAKNKAMTEVTIPATLNGLPVTEIAENGFIACRVLKNVVFKGNNLKILNRLAFSNCDALETVVIPEGVTHIAKAAFCACMNLKSVSFPASLASIAEYNDLFERVPTLETITVAEGNEYYKADDNCLIEIATGKLLAGTNLSVIPNYVTQIETLAFWGRRIQTVTIPASVRVIGSYAFQDCCDLKEINFAPNGRIEKIGYAAFSGCTDVSSIELPSGINVVQQQAFRWWTNRQTITIKGFASAEEADAVWGTLWRDMCGATVRYDLDTDGEYNRHLRFSLNADGTAYSVRFRNRDVTEVTIPAIYRGLPVTEIASNAFYGCFNLQRVTVEGNNLRTIGSNAFFGCEKLESFDVPEGVEAIGSNAFMMCDSLKSLSFPASLTAIVGVNVWSSSLTLMCGALETITVDGGNSVYKSDGNCLIEIATNTLLSGANNAVIPAYVTVIGAGAFCGSSTQCVTVEAGVLSVGRYAFRGWTAEQTIIIKGFASEEEADAAWGKGWRELCNATVIYEG